MTTGFYGASAEAWKEAIPNARVKGDVPGYRNIQLPEVNALAAALAVMEWRRRTGQYVSESTSFSTSSELRHHALSERTDSRERRI